MRAVIIGGLLLCLTSAVTAMDPPAVEWEKLYPAEFADVVETPEGQFLCTGWASASGDCNCLFCFDSNGDLLWEFSDQGNPYPRIFASECIQILQDSSIIIAGLGLIAEVSTQTAIAIAKLSSSGGRIWTQFYEIPEANVYAYALSKLPDGGFAVCGEIDPEEGMNQAWILRTDAQGDTLWTREWGWEYNDKAMSILYIDNGLTVLMHGNTPTTPGGPHLVRYDLDGNMLWETDIPVLAGKYGQDMCEATDGGLLILTNNSPTIAHTDYYGNVDWYTQPPYWDRDNASYGWSIDTTMDGGILYGGENRYQPPGNNFDIDPSGMIVRMDYEGSFFWSDQVYNSGCFIISSVRQLSQGGYIAAGHAWSSVNGSQGFLIKYAPELGIEDAGSLPSMAINTVSPNPVTSSATIEFSLIEDGEASLTLYDLNGRVVEVIIRELFSEGQHTMQWTPGGISSGCYLLRLSSANGSVTRNVVFLK